jgi:hypothetical protein
MVRITLNQLLPIIIVIRKHTTIATINVLARGIRLHPAEDQIIPNLQIAIQIIPRLQTITHLGPRIIAPIPLLREVLLQVRAVAILRHREVLHRVRGVVILHLPEVLQEVAALRQVHRVAVVQAAVAQVAVAAVIVNPTLMQY